MKNYIGRKGYTIHKSELSQTELHELRQEHGETK